MEKTDRVRDVCVRYIYMPVAACGTSDSPAIPYALSPRSVPRTLHPPAPRAYGFTVALELLKERYLLLCTTLGSNLLKCYSSTGSSRCALNLLNWRYRVVLVYSE